MSWQIAIDALRSHFGENARVFDPPTEACQRRALAWMEARSFTDPMHWPTRIRTLPDDMLLSGGIEIEFCNGDELQLLVQFHNDGTANRYEYCAGLLVSTGQIALPEGEAGETAADSLARTRGGF